MEIIQIVGIGIVATILAITIKQQRPELAIHVSIVAGVLILVLLLGKLISVVDILQQMSRKAKLDNIYLSTILKIIGIAYIAEFGAQVCKDAGEGAIASKIELGGKLIIMVLAMPILVALLEVILKILP